MASEKEVFDNLMQEIREINTANGWKVPISSDWEDNEYKIPALLALIMSEAVEALEGFRHNDKANFAEELADIMIRVLGLCGGMQIDIAEEVRRKLEKNRHRGHKHGGKRV